MAAKVAKGSSLPRREPLVRTPLMLHVWRAEGCSRQPRMPQAIVLYNVWIQVAPTRLSMLR